MILSWTKVAKNIYSELKQEIEKSNYSPTLGAILVWDNSGSLRYIKQKKKWAEKVWITFKLFQFEKNISEMELLKNIEKLNADKNMNGYIVQLPLPNHINTKNIINSISPKKDVDGFHPENQGKILIWDTSGFVPCTPAGIIELLKSENIEIIWKQIVILWKSNIVWKPITMLLINAGATVISCNSKTPDISKYTKTADIIISATGIPWIISLKNIWKNTIIIDVGFWIVDNKIVGDAIYEPIEKNGNLITPVPGWVGPMTVAILMKNTLKAYKNQLWIQ